MPLIRGQYRIIERTASRIWQRGGRGFLVIRCLPRRIFDRLSRGMGGWSCPEVGGRKSEISGPVGADHRAGRLFPFLWFLRIDVWNFLGAWCLSANGRTRRGEGFGAFFRRGRVERSAYALVMRAGDCGGIDLRRLGQAVSSVAAKFAAVPDANACRCSRAAASTNCSAYATGLDARSESSNAARHVASRGRACEHGEKRIVDVRFESPLAARSADTCLGLSALTRHDTRRSIRCNQRPRLRR